MMEVADRGISAVDNCKYFPNVEEKRAAILQTLQRAGTPVFVCDRNILIDRYQELQQSLSTHWHKHVIGYSFKTNYQVAQSGVLQQQGAWAEVVSGREYRMARQLCVSGDKIVFNGPFKSDDDLRTSLSEGALVNLNDHDELLRVATLASRGEAVIEIGLRISSNLPRLGHSRFGFSLENSEASDAVEQIRQHPQLNLTALHTHLYGDTDDADLYRLAASRLAEFAKQHVPDYSRTLKYINLGGGFPAHTLKPKSREKWNPQPIDSYVRAITDTLRPYFPEKESSPTLIVEPGRYLTSDSMLLVVNVTHVKERGGRQVVNCDGSISMVPLTHYCPQMIQAYDGQLIRRDGATVPTTIHGATCRENDILYEGHFQQCRPGDHLIYFGVGAYNSNLSPDFIFESPSMKML